MITRMDSGGTSLDRGLRDGIGAHLRRALAGTLGEPLPNAHVDLILALRRRERERRGTEQK